MNFQGHSFHAGDGPLVLDSPHSGTQYPPDFGYACALKELRQAEDTHVEQLWSFAAPMGQSFLQAHFPRSYIDANRATDELDPEMLDGPWPHPLVQSNKLRLGMGLIWKNTISGSPIYSRGLEPAHVAHRISTCWEPYHAVLERAIRDAQVRHGYCVHINCHSMPSTAPMYESHFGGWTPSDFVVSDRHGATAAPALTAWIAGFIRSRGWRVGVNFPYRGEELIRRFSAPAAGRHSVQIEVNRRLYMDEQSFALHSGAEAVRETFRALTEALLQASPSTWTETTS